MVAHRYERDEHAANAATGHVQQLEYLWRSSTNDGSEKQLGPAAGFLGRQIGRSVVHIAMHG